MKRLLLPGYAIVILLCCQFSLSGKGQSNAVVQKTLTVNGSDAHADSSREEQIKKYYHLAKQYKDGDGVTMDYAKAFYYFSQAAALGDAQSEYAVGYMKYKGLGTAQDYALAANLFRQGAYAGRDNSEYFLGLCYRNGYGVMQNEDSAQYWLKKSAALGYKQAILELQSKAPENSNAQAAQLIQKIHNAAIPEQVAPNQFIAIQPQKPDSSIIAGDYEGYVIQYDWSGKYPVSAKKLQLFLEASLNPSKGGTLVGKWLEENADSVTVRASLQKDSLVFDSTKYRRKDHYSQTRGIEYDFQNAALNLVRKGDSVYLAGNIYMFSPDRKEPSKPLLVALARTTSSNPTDSSLINKQHNTATDSSNTTAAKLLSVYPNPFTSYINVEFRVNEATEVGIELYNMAGRKVYTKPPQQLARGIYKIRIEPSLQLAQQTYLLRLVFDGGREVIKVIKK